MTPHVLEAELSFLRDLRAAAPGLRVKVEEGPKGSGGLVEGSFL